jgi:hypothetical protein
MTDDLDEAEEMREQWLAFDWVAQVGYWTSLDESACDRPQRVELKERLLGRGESPDRRARCPWFSERCGGKGTWIGE